MQATRTLCLQSFKSHQRRQMGVKILDQARDDFDSFHDQDKAGIGRTVPHRQAREDSVREAVGFFKTSWKVL